MPSINKKRTPEGPFYRDLGRTMRVMRTAAGKSQIDAAAHIDVSSQQFQKYEEGSNRIPVDRLVSLASFLKVPLSQFLADERDASRSATASLINQYASRECQALLRYFLAIDDERVRADVLNFLTTMSALNDRSPHRLAPDYSR